MSGAFLEIGVVLVLVGANGLLAASEIAVVASRRARLRARAKDGSAGARTALELASTPGRFLSTVQLGITAIAVVAGAFGGARVAGTLAPALTAAGVPAGASHQVAIVIVVGLVTLLTVVLGELVPKRIALHDPEGVAARLAGPMRRLSVAATPLVRLLERASDGALWVVGLRTRSDADISEEEIRGMIAHATEAGVLEATEQQITERLFRLSDTRIGSLMTPREAIVWLDRRADSADWRRALGEIRHTRYVVADGGLDQVAGYVKVQELLGQALEDGELRLDPLLRKPHLLPGWTPVFRLLELFQWSGVHISLVTDDRGRVAGLVTLNDVLEGIVGDLPRAEEVPEPEIVERADGSWLVDGRLPFDAFLEAFGLADDDSGRHSTVHAFMVDRLAGSPRAATAVEWRGLRVEVVDMDGSRVDKVLVTRIDA